MMVTATALCAQARQIELLTNGDGTDTRGWNTDQGAWYELSSTGCVQPSYNHALSTISQTVTLEDFVIARSGLTLTASVRALCKYGSRVWNAKVYQLDARGNVLSTHVVMDRPGEEFELTDFSIEFQLNGDAHQLKYELNAQDDENAPKFDAPGFQDRSLTVSFDGYLITFVSEGATAGKRIFFAGDAAEVPTAPTLSRNGYRFLGYFTDASGGVQVYDGSFGYVSGGSSGWTPTSDATLYAR